MELLWATIILIIGGAIGWMALIALYVTYVDDAKFPRYIPAIFFTLMLSGWFGSLIWAGVLGVQFLQRLGLA